ncbi:putative membrane protein [Clostridium bornimense]|uniref:Putative membrane protein n=1 Tax=Clostridium bornimense TaxID=1216932 RepID=W6S1L8_9CLOT|nr:hypothetical protein [Clostridium bornimense]CDM68187.1 putative membrane protein [Clostridium bornimense]
MEDYNFLNNLNGISECINNNTTTNTVNDLATLNAMNNCNNLGLINGFFNQGQSTIFLLIFMYWFTILYYSSYLFNMNSYLVNANTCVLEKVLNNCCKK